MRIALINENSQAAKNALVERCLREVAEPLGHVVDNYGMYTAEDECQLTYVMAGLLAGILINSGAAEGLWVKSPRCSRNSEPLSRARF